MYTALRATTRTLVELLLSNFKSDPLLTPFSNGTMIVSLNTPQEMVDSKGEGLSIWLYRVIRDSERLNAPPERIAPDQLKRPPLPLRLYYLITPLIKKDSRAVPETEQEILGKVLQIFHDHPIIRGADLHDDFIGTDVELHIRLEPMSLEEITRVWEALEGSYQLSVSYEVSVVNIESDIEPEKVSPVLVVLPEHGVIVSSEPK